MGANETPFPVYAYVPTLLLGLHGCQHGSPFRGQSAKSEALPG